jgi:ribosomal protein S20
VVTFHRLPCRVSRRNSHAKWRFKRAYAYRLILGAQLFNCLAPIGAIRPHHEAQVRPLYAKDLSEDQKRAAWLRAVDLAGGQEPTAAQVKAAVAELKSPVSAPKKPRHPQKKSLHLQAFKNSLRNLLDKAEMCIDSGKPDLAAKLVREAKEKLDKL